jgi:hypothetical protein
VRRNENQAGTTISLNLRFVAGERAKVLPKYSVNQSKGLLKSPIGPSLGDEEDDVENRERPE